MRVALANLLLEILMVRDGVLSLSIRSFRVILWTMFYLVFVFSAGYYVCFCTLRCQNVVNNSLTNVFSF